jgi:arylsulfatase A-like enzyme
VPEVQSAAPATRRDRLREVAIIATWSALATGLAQVLLIAITFYLRGELVFVSRDVTWMAPLGYLVIFLGIGVVAFICLPLISPRLAPVGLTVFSYVGLGVFSVLIRYSQLSRWAILALAAGVGVQAARTVTRAPDLWLARLRRGAFILLGITVALGVATRGGRALRGRAMVADLPAAKVGAPNVLLLILDTVTALDLSLYGYHRPTTPNLEKLAPTSVVFDRAYSTASWTLPSHASMLTGAYAYELNASYLTPLDRSRETLSEALGRRGYRTGGFVANTLYAAWDSGIERGFDTYQDYQVSIGQTMLSPWLSQTNIMRLLANARTWRQVKGAIRQFNWRIQPTLISDRKPGAQVVDDFLRWQSDVGERPFFAMLNLFDAHVPRYNPGRYARLYAPYRSRDRYDAAITYMDEQVGRMVDSLAKRGVLDNTVLIVTADHGELIGEHGLQGHSTSLYFPTLYVPLVIRHPGRLPKAARVQEPVSLRDLAATIVDLAGADSTRFPGVSLAELVAGEREVTSPVISETRKGINIGRRNPSGRGTLRSIIDGDLHYIRNGDGVEELYDLKADRAEAHNLAATDAGKQVVAAMRGRLQQFLVKAP